MTKFVLDLKDHPEVAACWDEYDQRMRQFKEEYTFMEKKMENLLAERDRYSDAFWTRTDNYAVTAGCLDADYNPKDWHTRIDPESRQMFVKKCDHEHESGTQQFIMSLSDLFGKGPFKP